MSLAQHNYYLRNKDNPEYVRKNREAAKRYVARYRERVRDITKNTNLFSHYKIDLEIFREMVKKREGKCDICGRYEGESLSVDHNHDSGKIRGLLCNNCNRAIGLIGEDPNILSRAVNYLCLNFNGARDECLKGWPKTERKSIVRNDVNSEERC